MTIGELVEELISIKRIYGIHFPDDEAINICCNLLDKLDRNKEVSEVLYDKHGILQG